MTLLTPEEVSALGLSLRIATVGVACALPVALAAALLLARGRFAGRTLLDAVVHLPLVLPPVVVGYLLLLSLGRQGAVGAWLEQTLGWRLVFNWTGAALAAGVMTLPFQVRAIRQSLEATGPALSHTASSLGAAPLDRFLTITLPLALPGIAGGLITAYAAALGEFGAIITFVSNIPGETQTLPLAIYSALQTPGGEATAARLAAIAIALALAGLVLGDAVSRALHRRLT